MPGVYKIDGLKALERELRRFGKDVERSVRRAAFRAALFGVKEAIEGSPRATGTLRTSWRRRKTKTGAMVFSITPHAYFVEFGRKPGGFPPIGPIYQWVKAKGLVTKLGRWNRKRGKAPPRRIRKHRAMRTIAFLIARKIAKYGSKPQFVLRKTIRATASAFWREVQHEIAGAMRRPPATTSGRKPRAS